MGRIKIWGYTLLALAVGAATLYLVSRRVASDASERMSATMRAGTAQLEAAAGLLAERAQRVAERASSDPALWSRVVGAPGPVAEAALRAAAIALEVNPEGALLGVATDRGTWLRAGERVVGDEDGLAEAALEEAGLRYLPAEGGFWAVATVEAGPGVRLAFGLPSAPALPERIRAATGADLTLLGARHVSTLANSELASVVSVARRAGGAAVDGGRMASASLVPGMPSVSVLFASAPAFRARALSLPGMDGEPVAVVSVAARPYYATLALFQQVMLASLALLFIVGLVLGLLPERAVTARVPEEMASAADRIAAGDFEARVPRMSGTFGVVADALNRATEAARQGRGGTRTTATVAPVTGVVTVPVAAANDPFAAKATPAPAPEAAAGSTGEAAAAATAVPAAPVAVPAKPAAAAPAPEPPAAPSAPVPAAPAARPAVVRPLEVARPLEPVKPAATAEPAPARPTLLPASTPVRFTVVSDLKAPKVEGAAAIAVTLPAPADPTEAQWQEVFRDFLRTREECGEQVLGITWERFRDKLQKNRDALAQKYDCRTVRFQVHVKDGRAALKATPIR